MAQPTYGTHRVKNPGLEERQQRLDAFVHEGGPPADRRLELLCEDHVGTYVLPFLCRWSSGDWESVETGERVEAVVIGMSARWGEANSKRKVLGRPLLDPFRTFKFCGVPPAFSQDKPFA